MVSLIIGAWPAFRTFGPAFVVTQVWNPVTHEFGALAPIYGTLVTSAIAMLIGIPVAFGIAVFITEICPIWLKRPIGDDDRIAGGDPEHHLRHMGPLCVCPVCPAVYPAGNNRLRSATYPESARCSPVLRSVSAS